MASKNSEGYNLPTEGQALENIRRAERDAHLTLIGNSHAIANTLKTYATAYERPPYGREVEGTAQLLRHAACLMERLIKACKKDG